MRNIEYSGPSMSISQEIDEMKYRQKGESFNDKIMRIARALSDAFNAQTLFSRLLYALWTLPKLPMPTTPSSSKSEIFGFARLCSTGRLGLPKASLASVPSAWGSTVRAWLPLLNCSSS